jgi:hypothetical protein
MPPLHGTFPPIAALTRGGVACEGHAVGQAEDTVELIPTARPCGRARETPANGTMSNEEGRAYPGSQRGGRTSTALGGVEPTMPTPQGDRRRSFDGRPSRGLG